MCSKHTLWFYLVYLNAKQKGRSIMKCVPAPQTHTSSASNLHFKAVLSSLPCMQASSFIQVHTHHMMTATPKNITHTHTKVPVCVYPHLDAVRSHPPTHRHKQFELVLAGPLYFRPLPFMWRSTMFLSQRWLKRCFVCCLLIVHICYWLALKQHSVIFFTFCSQGPPTVGKQYCLLLLS